MTGRSHLGVGILACAAVQTAAPWALSLYDGIPLLPIALGSLLPDVDCPDSALGRRVPGAHLGRIGRIAVGLLLIALSAARNGQTIGLVATSGGAILLCGLLGHRGFTHSLLGIALATLLAESVFPVGWQCMSLCYALHVLADALTPAGVPLLWPVDKRFGLGFMRTGTMFYHLLHIAVWTMVVVALLGRGVTLI